MPIYYNPNPSYPGVYGNPMMMGQASFAPYAQQPMMPAQSYATGPNCAMAWVDGEIEARGRQMPQGVTQFAMWDTNKPVIYLKSMNQMGMPNPMQIIHYTFEEQQNNLPAGQSGDSMNVSGAEGPDMSQYVTKDDLNQMRQELRNMMAVHQSGANQNGSESQRNTGNRGGNR